MEFYRVFILTSERGLELGSLFGFRKGIYRGSYRGLFFWILLLMM